MRKLNIRAARPTTRGYYTAFHITGVRETFFASAISYSTRIRSYLTRHLLYMQKLSDPAVLYAVLYLWGRYWKRVPYKCGKQCICCVIPPFCAA